MSSPTLRKLCLPCISLRNHRRHHHHHHHPLHSRQQSNKNQTAAKNNQRQTITISTAESNVVELSHRLEVAPRTSDPISITPVVHSSEYLGENDVNHSHEQQHQHFETSLQNEQIEKKDNEISVKAEIIPTKVDSELILQTLSSSGNEITRSNEDDLVGIFLFVDDSFRLI